MLFGGLGDLGYLEFPFGLVSIGGDFGGILPIGLGDIVRLILHRSGGTFFFSTMDIVLLACLWGLSLLRSSLVVLSM